MKRRLKPATKAAFELLSVSCRQFSPNRSPDVLYTSIQMGKDIGIDRAKQLKISLEKCDDINGAIQALIVGVLADLDRDGYGEAVMRKRVVFSTRDGVLEASFRIHKPLCLGRVGAAESRPPCRCFAWFWRGLLIGLLSEMAWIATRTPTDNNPKNETNLSPSRQTGETEFRSVWDCRTRSNLTEGSSFYDITVEIGKET